MLSSSAPSYNHCGASGRHMVRSGEPNARCTTDDYCTAAIDRERIRTLYICHVLEVSS